MDMSWDEQAPDVRVLWMKDATARKPHLCDSCGEPIGIGERYTSHGVILDGKFDYSKWHWPTCPKVAERDRIELEEQYAKDWAFFNPEA